jgi:NAD(P)-dependent dehydrogenase (short-subunit alcohol dehydrogenase family)
MRITNEGGSVTLTGTSAQRLDEVRAALPSARVVRNDAADPDSAAELVAAIGDQRLDGLWLNAGYADIARIDEVKPDFFDRMMATNVRAPFLQLAALSEHLVDGASVVVTSSTATYEGSPVYAATKGALVAAVRGWASALADRGIRVHTLVPGAIHTDFRRFMDPETRESFESDVVSRVPLGRVGTPDEAAAVALFLLSDDTTYVTASQYAVDGGLTKV